LVNNLIIRAHRRTIKRRRLVPKKPKFTRIPKVKDLIDAEIPAEVIPTYAALADFANNKTGLCWPKMETLAKTLGRSVRTVQRHLHLLKERGLIEFVERRRHRGRFSSYLYKVVHIARTTGHPGRVASILKGQTKPRLSTKQTKIQECDHEERRKQEAERRREGFEWLFD
jgi:predicted transcriptional regulator